MAKFNLLHWIPLIEINNCHSLIVLEVVGAIEAMIYESNDDIW